MGMTAEQILKGYEHYCCPILYGLTTDPVRIVNHPILHMQLKPYDKNSVLKTLKTTKNKCWMTNVTLNVETISFQPILFETLIFACEARKGLAKLNPKEHESIISDFNHFFSKIEDYPEQRKMMEMAVETLKKLAQDKPVDLPIETIGTLLSFGVPCNFILQNAYAKEAGKKLAEAQSIERKKILEEQQQQLKSLHEKITHIDLAITELNKLRMDEEFQVLQYTPNQNIHSLSHNSANLSPSSLPTSPPTNKIISGEEREKMIFDFNRKMAEAQKLNELEEVSVEDEIQPTFQLK